MAAGLRISGCQLWVALQFYLLMQATLSCCYWYKVGDLDAWNMPTSTNPDVYVKWSKNHFFQPGDTLFFLYPPSQDSVLQVTPQSYNSCNLKDPILTMNNGNSIFNITSHGDLFFISGAEGHCKKSQKMHISVSGNGSYYVYPPADAPSADSPSYPTVFGGAIPVMSSPSSAFITRINPVFTAAVIVFTMLILVGGRS